MLSKLLSNITKKDGVPLKDGITDKKEEGLKASQQIFKSLLQALQNDGSSSKKNQLPAVNDAAEEESANSDDKKDTSTNVLGGSFLSVGDKKMKLNSKNAQAQNIVVQMDGQQEAKEKTEPSSKEAEGSLKSDAAKKLADDKEAKAKGDSSGQKSGGTEVEEKEIKDPSAESENGAAIAAHAADVNPEKSEQKSVLEKKMENTGEASSGKKSEASKPTNAQVSTGKDKLVDNEDTEEKKKIVTNTKNDSEKMESNASAVNEIKQQEQKAKSEPGDTETKKGEKKTAKTKNVPNGVESQQKEKAAKTVSSQNPAADKVVVKDDTEQKSTRSDSAGSSDKPTKKASRQAGLQSALHPQRSEKSLPVKGGKKEPLKFQSAVNQKAGDTDAGSKQKQTDRNSLPQASSVKMSFKGQEVETAFQKKAKKKSGNSKKQKAHATEHTDNKKRQQFLNRLGITNTRTQKRVRPVDFQGFSAVKADQSDMSLGEQKEMWEKQVSESIQSADDKQTKTTNASSSMKLGRMPVANMNLRRKILPGLTKSLKKAAASAQKDFGDWQKHTFKLDGDKNIHLSVRESKGVLHVKMGSLNLDLSKLLQQNIQQIRHHLKQEFGTEINLQFDGQGQEQHQQENSQSSSSRRRNYRSGMSGSKNVAPESLVGASDQGVRNFGYNKMEWTA